MKAIITLIGKVFRTQKQTAQIVQVEEEMTEEQFDAWIVSIRQKPQYSSIGGTVSVKEQIAIRERNSSYRNDGLEEAGCLVLA